MYRRPLSGNLLNVDAKRGVPWTSKGKYISKSLELTILRLRLKDFPGEAFGTCHPTPNLPCS